MKWLIKYSFTISILCGSFLFISAQENNSILCSDGIDNDGDGFVDCEDQECVTLVNEGCRTCFNDGLSFADIVIDYFNPCGNSNIFDDPERGLGVSDHNEGSGRFVSLGGDGWLKLGFTNNILINSGTDVPDLWVFEIGPAVEPTLIALRPIDAATRNALIAQGISDGDSDGFYEIGTVSGATSALDIDLFVSGLAAGELKFDAVELIDIGGRGCNNGAPGADIDAICALSSLPLEICSNGVDDDLDGLVDCDDPDLAAECCCISTITLDLGEDIVNCTGNKIILNAGSGFSSYLWDNGSTTQLYSVSTTGTYSLTVTDELGCEFSDRIRVTYIGLPTKDYNLFKCPEASLDFNGNVFDQVGVFRDTIESTSGGCDSVYRYTVSNYETSHKFLGPDLYICGESEINLISLSNNTTWPDGSTSSEFRVTESGIIIAQTTDSNMCILFDTIEVQFIRVDDFFMPNAFSPNDDGINDVLKPLFANQANSAYRLKVFDRWGNILIDIDGIDVSWNGQVDGRFMLNGTYLWTLEFVNEECDILESYHGNVSLVR